MKILNFGSINIDHVYQVPHFLQPGETMPAASYARFPGGKGFNQSVALARAGACVYHAGHVGPDGAWLADFLRDEGVNVDFLSTVETPTGHGIIQVDPSGQNCILIEGGANRRLTAADVSAAIAGAGIGAGDVVLLQNETSATAEIIRQASAAGAKVAFNAAPFGANVADLPLDLVGLFIVNEIEGAALCGLKPDANGYDIIGALREKFPEADILLTLGVNGCIYGAHDNWPNTFALPARSVRAVDTTAAGDTFIGFFLAGLAAGLDPTIAIDRATAASAICVSRPGAAPSIPRACELSFPWDNARLRGSCDKDPVSYAVGEPMVFTVELVDAPSAADAEGCIVRWTCAGDDGAKSEGSVPAADLLDKPLVIRTSISRPGFVHVYVELLGPNGRPMTQPVPQPGQWWAQSIFFDGGAGAEIEKLRGEPEPADFDEFWARQKAKLATVPVRAERREIPSPDPEVRLYVVTVDAPAPRPVTGYLSVPVAASAGNRMPVHALFHGYGTSIEKPQAQFPHDEIFFDVNAHGVELGRDWRYYREFYHKVFSNGYSYGFDPAQNKDPENAYFLSMALRDLRALEYLKTLPEWNGSDLRVNGGSQGGLQTLWMASLDADVTSASAEVPWCCDLAGINTDRMSAPWHIPYVPAIDYFDPINHGKRVECTLDIPRAGLGDYTCPPSGIAILYNNLRAPKSIKWVQGSQHGYIPPEPNQVAVRAEK